MTPHAPSHRCQRWRNLDVNQAMCMLRHIVHAARPSSRSSLLLEAAMSTRTAPTLEPREIANRSGLRGQQAACTTRLVGPQPHLLARLPGEKSEVHEKNQKRRAHERHVIERQHRCKERRVILAWRTGGRDLPPYSRPRGTRRPSSTIRNLPGLKSKNVQSGRLQR